MTQEIIAYLADDGQVFRHQADAEFADYRCGVATLVGAFLAARGTALPEPPAHELLAEWELWRIGGRDGWLQLPAPAPAIPVEAPAAAPVAEHPPAKVKAKPGPKPKAKPEKERSAIADALDAARITRERQLAEARPGAVLPKAPRLHVAVVGLFNLHHANIEREFGDALKLSLHDADCIPKLAGLRAYHKVVVMTKFISHKHVEVLESIGQKPLLVSGGISELKTALTNIYVNG